MSKRFPHTIRTTVSDTIKARIEETRQQLEDDDGYRVTMATAIRYIIYNHYDIEGTPTDSVRN